MAKIGLTLTGIDSSADLIAEAKRKTAEARLLINFVIGDILALPMGCQFDAILCRGVLNDLTSTDARRGAFSSFAKSLCKGGVLMLDVRKWESTAARKTSNPITEKAAQTEKGQLVFRNVAALQPETHSLLISETYELHSSAGREMDTFNFVMKCWTQEELGGDLSAAGFDEIEYFGDYDGARPIGSTDHLVAFAHLARK